jgi:hypothetical protein
MERKYSSRSLIEYRNLKTKLLYCHFLHSLSSQWGTWLATVAYYCENYTTIESV